MFLVLKKMQLANASSASSNSADDLGYSCSSVVKD